MIIKSIFYSTLIIGIAANLGGGYALMVLTTPNREMLRLQLERDGLLSSKDQKEREENNKKLMRIIMENANSDRPVWDVRFK